MWTSLALVAAQATFLPIDNAADDDGAHVALFDATGASLYVGHLEPGSVTRLDVASGAIVGSVGLGTSVTDLALGATAGELLALDGPGFALHRLAGASLTPLATIAVTPRGAFEVFVGPTANRAVIECNDPLGGGRSLSVVDLAAGAEVAVYSLPSFTAAEAVRTSFLADDDRTFVTLVGDEVQGFELRALDVVTGATTGAVVLNLATASALLAPSGDRSVFAVPRSRFAPSSVSVELYDATTLALLSSTNFVGPSPAHDLALDTSGTVASLRSRSHVLTAALTGGLAAFQSVSLPDATDFAWSADRTRLLLFGFGGAAALFDANGGLVFETRAPRGARAAIAPVGARFGLLGLWSDRVRVIDAGPQLAIAADVNTGPGVELDGPLVFEALEGRDEALVAAVGSDVLVRLDLRTGLLQGATLSARGPHVLAERADGMVVVGHEDGRLFVVDPAGPTIVGQTAFTGPIVELHPEPTGAMVWARVEITDRDLLLRVDTQPAVPIVDASTLLRGRGNPRALDEAPTGDTLAIDVALGRAFAATPSDGRIQSFDLPFLTPGAQWVSPPSASRRLALSSDGSRLFSLSNGLERAVEAFDATLSTGVGTSTWRTAVPNDGFGSAPEIAVAGDGRTVFADLSGFTPFGQPLDGLVALDAQSGAVLASLGNVSAASLAASANDLAFVAGGALHLTRFTAGAFSPPEATPLPADTAGRVWLDRERGWVLAPAQSPTSFVDVGLVTVDLFDGRTSSHCTAGTPNATGVQAELRLDGSPFAGGVTIASISGLQPGSMTGILVVGDALSPPTPLGFGIGELCTGGAFGRLVAPPQIADANGVQRHAVNTAPLSTSVGSAPVLPGDTRVFQLWHRDVLPSGAATANTSTAVALTFR